MKSLPRSFLVWTCSFLMITSAIAIGHVFNPTIQGRVATLPTPGTPSQPSNSSEENSVPPIPGKPSLNESADSPLPSPGQPGFKPNTPTVTLETPSVVESGTTVLNASVTNADEVVFRVNDSVIASVQSPFVATWNATPGTYTVTASLPGKNVSDSSTVTVTVPCSGCSYQGECVANMKPHPVQSKACMNGSFVSLPSHPNLQSCSGCSANGSCFAAGDAHPVKQQFCYSDTWVSLPSGPAMPAQDVIVSPVQDKRYPASRVPVALRNVTGTAKLYLDGEEYGTLSEESSTTITVRPGRHDLRVVAGSRESTVTFHARPAVSLKARVEQGRRRVEIQKMSNTPHVVTVDDVFYSYTDDENVTLEGIPAGNRSVEVSTVSEGEVVSSRTAVNFTGEDNTLRRYGANVSSPEQVSFEGGVVESARVTPLPVNTGSITVREVFSLYDFEGVELRYLNVSAERVSNVTFRYHVPKMWTAVTGVDKDDVRLYHHNGSWQAVAGSLVGEDDDFVYYNATVADFSPFVIGASTTSQEASRAGAVLDNISAGESRVVSFGNDSGIREVRFTPSEDRDSAAFQARNVSVSSAPSGTPTDLKAVFDLKTDVSVDTATVVVAVDSATFDGISDVQGYHFVEEWKRVPTKHVGSVQGKELYELETGSFSYFALGRVSSTDSSSSSSTGETGGGSGGGGGGGGGGGFGGYDVFSDENDSQTGVNQTSQAQERESTVQDTREDVQGSKREQPTQKRPTQETEARKRETRGKERNRSSEENTEQSTEQPREIWSRSTWAMLLVAIFVVSAGGLVYLLEVESEDGSDDQGEYPELEQYIEKHRDLGEERLRRVLNKAGWPDHILDEEFEKYF